MPDYIIDNKWSKYNSDILSLEDLAEIDNDNLVIFVSSDRNDIYDEIRTEIINCIVKGRVVDLFPMVNENNDRKVEALRLWAKCAESIKLQGSVAEAGVRDGEFAQYINKYFPTKRLYLFDTFEGFYNEQIKNNMIEDKMFEVNMDYIGYDQEPRGMLPMPNPENVVIKKGFFPDTARDIKDTFCYVHLDMDIYQSIADGLHFFGPRMVEQGIIMIDDYYGKPFGELEKLLMNFA